MNKIEVWSNTGFKPIIFAYWSPDGNQNTRKRTTKPKKKTLRTESECLQIKHRISYSDFQNNQNDIKVLLISWRICDLKKWRKTKHDIETIGIRQRLDCNTTNVIYMLHCKRCLQNGTKNCQYIGPTGRWLRDRFNEHRRDVIKRHNKCGVAEHFCQPGHKLHDLQVTPLLQIHDKQEDVRRAKEQYFIGLANSLAPNGLNRTTDR